jgi:multiple sugar transport system substrate-binding protein
MKNLVKLLAMLLALSLVIGLAGTACAENIEIHYAFWHGALEDFYKECKADFEAAHPGVTIVLEPTSWDEYWTKLEAAATGGSIADVFHMNGVNIKKYADGGVLLPLDEYIASSDVDLKNYPAAMNEMYNYDGKQYGIPMDFDTIGLWYNKTLFDKAGIAYPTSEWTWDDLVAAAAAINALGDDIYGIAANYEEQQGFYNTVYACGGWFVDGDKYGFNEEGTRAGIQCWVDLMKAGVSPSEKSLEENPAYLQFMAGKLGMVFSGDWVVAEYVSPDSAVKDVIDVAELPLMPNGKRASVIHGKANCVSVTSAHPEEAWAWVAYLAGAEANAKLGPMGVTIPSYLAYTDMFFEAYPQYNMKIYSKAAAEYSYVYPSALNPEWSTIMWEELVKAFNLDITVDEACGNIMSRLGQ